MFNLRKTVAVICLLQVQFYIILCDSEYRLDPNIKPKTYNIKFNLASDYEVNNQFNSEVEIEFEVNVIPKNAKELRLHMKHVNIKEVLLKKGAETTDLHESYTHNSTLEMLILELNAPLEKTLYTLNIKYSGILHDDMSGLYRSSYIDENNERQWIATTQFQPTHARRAFPCFDEPSFKATFNIEITHSSKYHALSNSKVKKIVPSSSTSVTTFEPTPIMSTYLIAIIVSKFVKISEDKLQSSNSLEYTALHSPKEVIGTGEYGFSITPKLLNVMKDFTDVSYAASTINKLDQVAIPDFSAGAMENWGLVTYRETALLWDPRESSAKNKERVATVIAHELAHMWFGNLITLNWWSNTWLNEGFARYYQYHATAKIETEWELSKQFVIEQQQAVFVADANAKVQALSSDCNTPSEISSKFGTISYNKGASVIRMMEHFLGKSTFSAGIKSYFDSSNHFKNTEPKHLWKAMSDNIKGENNAYIKTNFENIMNRWIEQEGFPVVVVKKIANLRISITQERFLYSQFDNKTKWFIPLTYTNSDSKSFNKTTPDNWLDPTSNLQLPWRATATWIIFNIEASGYYRVKYDDLLYKKLEEGLKMEHFDGIPAITRAQIVDDALNLARGGYVSYETALDVVEYLKEDVDYYPWYSAFTAFAYLKRRIDDNSSVAPLLDKFIIQLMQNLYSSVRFEEGFQNQIRDHKRVLTLKWACELHVDSCIANSLESFKRLEEQNIDVDPNTRSVVYCTAMRNAQGNSSWYYLWDRFTKTKSAAEQVTILSALGCTKDKDILKEYLHKSIDKSSGIRSQDAQSVFSAVIIGNSENIPVAFSFLENNFKSIEQNYGSLNALSAVITNLADRLTTEEQLKALKEFVAKNRDHLKDAALVADSAIISVEENLAWIKENEEPLLNYLNAKLSNSATVKSISVMTALVLLIINLVV